jgi:acetolactate synthase small subunit
VVQDDVKLSYSQKLLIAVAVRLVCLRMNPGSVTVLGVQERTQPVILMCMLFVVQERTVIEQLVEAVAGLEPVVLVLLLQAAAAADRIRNLAAGSGLGLQGWDHFRQVML